MFFFCEDEVEVHELTKKERGQYPAILTEQTWSIKDLFYGFRDNFARGIQQVVPSGQDGSIGRSQVNVNHVTWECYIITVLYWGKYNFIY